MLPALSVGGEVRRLIALGGPAAITQLGAMMLGVVDMMMVGHVGVLEIDAAALGHLWLYITMMAGLGFVFGMDPVVSQAHGAADRRTMGLTLQRGILIALVASIPIGAAWLGTGPVLRLLGQAPELSTAADGYVQRQLPSLPAFMVFMALRQYLQGRGIVMPAVWIMLGANLFNVGANWVLIFGHLGVPPMGLEGAAIATASTRVFAFVCMGAWILAFGLHRDAWVPWSKEVFERAAWSRLLRMGLPISIHLVLEIAAFEGATLLAGRLGEIELAAHTITLNLASLAFMLPLGISLGTATRVGNLVGAGHAAAAQRTARIALVMGASVMMVSATAFACLRDLLPLAYTSDPAVVAMAARILPIAAAFQLFDGTQVVGAGVLRGMGTTRPTAVVMLIGFYGLGLPLATGLAFVAGLGVVGLWWGLAAGLAAVAAALVAWVELRGPAHMSVHGRPAH